MKLSEIESEEVVRVLKKLKNKKAPGIDEIPPECWKSFLYSPTLIKELTSLCNLCWTQGSIPEIWHTCEVAYLFKKSNIELCENYKSISLLCICFKILEWILFERLKEAGVESMIFPTQFSFRSHYGTRESLFAARRIIEGIWSQKNLSIMLLTLN